MLVINLSSSKDKNTKLSFCYASFVQFTCLFAGWVSEETLETETFFIQVGNIEDNSLHNNPNHKYPWDVGKLFSFSEIWYATQYATAVIVKIKYHLSSILPLIDVDIPCLLTYYWIAHYKSANKYIHETCAKSFRLC